VRALEALGVEVLVPDVSGSGRAPLSQGMISTAGDKAESVAEQLGPYLDEGYDVVVIEPSDLAMFRDEYSRLLPETEADRLAENSYEILEYVYGLLSNGADPGALAGATGEEQVAYHSHCQQRTLELEAYSVEVMRECGYEVTTTDAECCGMAGSFGYKEQYYDLSVDVGEALAEQLRGRDADHVVASGTSCTDQIDDVLDVEPKHVIELLAPGEVESA
jgi:Fe-S oxidoreductase